MTAIFRIARREWREQLREPASLVAPVATFAMIDGAVALFALALARVAAHPGRESLLGQFGVSPEIFAGAAAVVVETHAFLGFSQLVGLCAVNAGQAILHDRQVGTLSFVLLAPVGRGALLAGKLLGAIALPLLAGSVLNLGGALALLLLPPTAAAGAGLLPDAPGWWVAWLLGGPSWCLLTGAVATIIGAVSRDVRTAQQGVWFVLLFAALIGSSLLTSQLDSPLGGLAVAAMGLAGAGTALGIGSAILARDLWR